MKKKIEINGRKLTGKDIVAIKKHPKTIAFFERGKSLLNGADLTILDQDMDQVKKTETI